MQLEIFVFFLINKKKDEIIINRKKNIKDKTWNIFIILEVYFHGIIDKPIIVKITPIIDNIIIMISILLVEKELKQ